MLWIIVCGISKTYIFLFFFDDSYIQKTLEWGASHRKNRKFVKIFFILSSLKFALAM